MRGTKLTHMRAWEMNGDGTRAGLAFTARDHEPLKDHYFAGVVIDDRHNTLTLYGALVHRDLFNPDIPYGLELWAPLRAHRAGDCGAQGPTQWAYFVLPMARVADVPVDADGYYTYGEYPHADGNTYPALTFTMHARHQWGRGPHPVRLVEVGAELEPAYLDPIPEHCNRAHVSTTMAPATAFQYTDNITHRKPARKGIS